MKKILLINPNTYDQPYPVFPLGLAYLEHALIEAGYPVQIADLHIDSIEDIHGMIHSFGPDVIGISIRNVDDVRIGVQEFFIDAIRDMIRDLRRFSSAPIVLGGCGFSIFPREIYERCQADFGIIGEGESALLEWLECRSPETIAGLVYRDGTGVRMNTPRIIAKEWIRWPQRNSRLMSFYNASSGMANVQTQRGCALQCCYCTYPIIEGRHYRSRDGSSIAEEFLYLKEMGVRYVFIVDSVFNTSPGHVESVCEALIRAGSPLPWGCFLRPKGLNRSLAQTMSQAGLQHVEFGTDSLDDSVLRQYRKEFSVSDVVESSAFVREAGIEFCHFLILGGPGETEQSMENTFSNSRMIHGGLFFPSIGMRVYPRTRLEQVAINPVSRSNPVASLLLPRYHIESCLSENQIRDNIRRFMQDSPDWVDWSANPKLEMLSKRLRKKGVVGPLWNYLRAMRVLS